MLMTGFSITVDMLVCKRLTAAIRSIISITIEADNVFLCVKNERFWSDRFTKYNLLHLNGLFEGMLSHGKVVFSFSQPRHKLIIDIEDPSELLRFMSCLYTFIKDHNKKLDLESYFDPLIVDFIDTPAFNKYSLNTVNCLSTLILENCSLSSIPEQVGLMPISYLSLTCSTLGTAEYEKEYFFDFMNIGTITKTLNILEMNKTNIKELPFQIYFLKNLHTLSVAGNNLTFIPHYIGDLGKLSSLYINNNLLPFLPKILSSKTFKSLNISNNKFCEFSQKLRMEKDLLAEDKRKEEEDFLLMNSQLTNNSEDFNSDLTETLSLNSVGVDLSTNSDTSELDDKTYSTMFDILFTNTFSVILTVLVLVCPASWVFCWGPVVVFELLFLQQNMA